MILSGDTDLKQDDHFVIQRFHNDTEARMKMKDIFETMYDKDNFQKLHVITPQQTGIIGVQGLNLLAQEIFHTADEDHICYGDDCFYIDDKVMTTKMFMVMSHIIMGIFGPYMILGLMRLLYRPQMRLMLKYMKITMKIFH